MDWLENGGLDSALDCLNTPESNDPVCYLVQKLEEICKNVFPKTSQNKEISETSSKVL